MRNQKKSSLLKNMSVTSTNSQGEYPSVVITEDSPPLSQDARTLAEFTVWRLIYDQGTYSVRDYRSASMLELQGREMEHSDILPFKRDLKDELRSQIYDNLRDMRYKEFGSHILFIFRFQGEQEMLWTTRDLFKDAYDEERTKRFKLEAKLLSANEVLPSNDNGAAIESDNITATSGMSSKDSMLEETVESFQSDTKFASGSNCQNSLTSRASTPTCNVNLQNSRDITPVSAGNANVGTSESEKLSSEFCKPSQVSARLLAKSKHWRLVKDRKEHFVLSIKDPRIKKIRGVPRLPTFTQKHRKKVAYNTFRKHGIVLLRCSVLKVRKTRGRPLIAPSLLL